MSVVSLSAEREARQPHWAGAVHCVGCQHEWQGVAPVGTLWLECPECHEPKGHPKYPFGGGVGDYEFECNCGGTAMVAYKRGTDMRFFIRCMGCGTDQTNSIFG